MPELFRLFFISLSSSCLLIACSPKQEKKPLTELERLQLRVDSVKTLAKDGDLITRLNDNIISHQVRLINNTDKSFSHAGIIETMNGVKSVWHIDADLPGADTVKHEPLDSFLNPKNNLSGGLFRYDLSTDEINHFLNEIHHYHDKKVLFDRTYIFQTDSLIYCSEMIAKSLRRATNNRIIIDSSMIPAPMLKMVYNYLERKHPIEAIAANPIIGIDNLYLNPHCKEILRFTLKQFPGQ